MICAPFVAREPPRLNTPLAAKERKIQAVTVFQPLFAMEHPSGKVQPSLPSGNWDSLIFCFLRWRLQGDTDHGRKTAKYCTMESFQMVSETNWFFNDKE
jgi:hypothetical protein